GVAWMGMERWIDHVLSTGVFVVLGRLLLPSAFGLVAAASVVILFLRVLVDLGFSRALVQRREITEDHVDTAFWTSVAAGAVFTVAVAAGAPLIALLYSQPALTNVVRALSLVFVFAALDTTQSALVERWLNFRVQAVRRLAANAAAAGVAVGLAVTGAGVWALVAQALVLEAVTVTLLWRMVSWRPRWRFSRASFADLASFGGRYSVLRVMWFLSGNVDDFLIGVFLGPLALGYYVIAYRVLVIFDELFAKTISRVSLTTYSKLQADRERLHEAFYKSVGMASTVGLPAYAGLALVAPQLVPLVFGAKWAPSVAVMQALAVVGMIRCSSAFNHSLVLSIGKVRAELRWSIATTTLVVAAFASSVHFGIVAVALGLVAVNLLLWPVRVLRLHYLTGIAVRRYAGRYLAPLPATAAMAAAVLAAGWGMRGHGDLATLGAEVVAGIVVYPLALWLTAPSAVREVAWALRVLRGGPGAG
ncbi:MAG: lipopolysaccharide biosynthesis protein, partial [Acidimicrobiales bacterium]